MKNILVLGAGRSASSLIRYLLNQSMIYQWHITVADFSSDLISEKVGNHKNALGLVMNIEDVQQREKEISKADLVISLLPPSLHLLAVETSLKFGKNILTASYITPQINNLAAQAEAKQILILMECGLDPGIDHMSSMAAIQKIRTKGGKLLSYRSYTGGLIAPKSDNNPWNYKFSWNPRNVVLAGQGTAKYLEKGQTKFIPYHQLFSRTEPISIDNHGEFEGYANRDSLNYKEVYGLHQIPTLLRGTLRKVGFCRSWNLLIQLGMTDDTYQMELPARATINDFTRAFLPEKGFKTTEECLCDYLKISIDSAEFKKLKWLGLFEDELVGLQKASPAYILQTLLEKKWKLEPADKDMIVMHHQFEFELDGKKKRLVSSLIIEGEDNVHTAMAKTVGLPLGIAAKLILENKVQVTGVKIPTIPELYEPILQELTQFGIHFTEKETEM